VLSVVPLDLWRATLKASEGVYFIRTGCPRSNISNKNVTRAFSSSVIRYCWRRALSSCELGSSVCAITERSESGNAFF
jgi:hypothetical protein